MDKVVVLVIAVCFAYQGYRLRKAGMHALVVAYSAAVAAMLAGYLYRWPDELRIAALAAATVLLLVGGYRLRQKNHQH